MTKVCEHPECQETFTFTKGRGRPALYCPGHRSTKYAMVRSRKHPELKASRIPQFPCCQEAGKKCPQHRSIPPQHMAYKPSRAERAVISELLDVWGHASIWNDRGWVLTGVEAKEDGFDW